MRDDVTGTRRQRFFCEKAGVVDRLFFDDSNAYIRCLRERADKTHGKMIAS